MILYEFLYGFPPFNADTAQEIFENILHRRIDWHEGAIELSSEVRDLMGRLMNLAVNRRLGTAGGATEVKHHPWFKDVCWDTLNLQEPNFVPKTQAIDDTDYFDDRGVKEQSFEDDDAPEMETSSPQKSILGSRDGIQVEDNDAKTANTKTLVPESKTKEIDFGGFMYRNLPLLEKANQKLVRKIQSGFSGADRMKTRSLLQLRQSSGSEISLTSLMRSFSLKNGKGSGTGDGSTESDSEHSGADVSLGLPLKTQRTRRPSLQLRSRNASEGSRKQNLSPLASFALRRGSQRSAQHLMEEESLKKVFVNYDVLIAVRFVLASGPSFIEALCINSKLTFRTEIPLPPRLWKRS